MPFKVTPILTTTNRLHDLVDTNIANSFKIDLQIVTMGQLKEIVK